MQGKVANSAQVQQQMGVTHHENATKCITDAVGHQQVQQDP